MMPMLPIQYAFPHTDCGMNGSVSGNPFEWLLFVNSWGALSLEVDSSLPIDSD